MTQRVRDLKNLPTIPQQEVYKASHSDQRSAPVPDTPAQAIGLVPYLIHSPGLLLSCYTGGREEMMAPIFIWETEARRKNNPAVPSSVGR